VQCLRSGAAACRRALDHYVKRIFTIEQYCLARLRQQPARCRFPFSQPTAHAAWRRNLIAALRRELGDRPQKVPLCPQVVERRNWPDYIGEKVILQMEQYMALPAWVLIPKRSPFISKTHKMPALLAAHGHGYGKDDVLGETHGQRARREFVHRLRYDYARQAVQRGYVVIAPDWRTFGERTDPDDWVRRPGRDGCDVASHAVQYFGGHLLGLNIWDGQRVLDYLASRPEVDPARIGCLGLSFGGTMTMYLTAFDTRIKVACISGYLSTLASALGQCRGNFCGSQAMPGLAKYADIPDVVLLAAPRPLCVEIGLRENCFDARDMLRAARYVRRGYRALGAADRFVIDAFPGPHQWSGRKAWDLFAHHLG
jgi:Abhydrolase family